MSKTLFVPLENFVASSSTNHNIPSLADLINTYCQFPVMLGWMSGDGVGYLGLLFSDDTDAIVFKMVFGGFVFLPEYEDFSRDAAGKLQLRQIKQLCIPLI